MTHPAPHSRPVLLGRGELNWPAIERKGGRYGLVGLYPESGGAESANPRPFGAGVPREHAGREGRLVARVSVPRRPHAPAPGAELSLARGKFFFTHVEDDGYHDGPHPNLVGVSPTDGRTEDWLDPAALHDLHHSVVELLFFPDEP